MLSRAIIDRILLGPLVGMRFTQDSAVLPEVWTAFALDPQRRIPLLITPYRSDSAGRLAQRIATRLGKHEQIEDMEFDGRGACVAYVDSLVVADLKLDELLGVVLPITCWWQQHAAKLAKRFGGDWPVEKILKYALGRVINYPQSLPPESLVPDDLARVLTLIGLIKVDSEYPQIDIAESLNLTSGRRRIAEAVLESFTHADWGHQLFVPPSTPPDAVDPLKSEQTERVYLVSLNRVVYPAIEQSVPSIKADAAMRLFNIDTSKLTWAVIDSGIDATHEAFKDASGNSRVIETYDFNRIRTILRVDVVLSESGRKAFAEELSRDSGVPEAEVIDRLKHVANDTQRARVVDWNLIRPLLRRPSDAPPYTDHGTHVAGILAAGETPDNRSFVGICPQMRLIDLRVLSSSIEETEFAVIAALQFVRFLNETTGYMVVHGVNMSLSIPHDVRNYACGRTPVCEEANRLASNKVVVVAAAGNLGWQPPESTGSAFARYNAISITDPGNAEYVITVGATHRSRPHTYGVSYFSSRGPTGDGRPKPDLVAPGEKIRSTVPGDEWGVKDGTSMAAPHVSGAAALLMGRHAELIGEPARIKAILCESATPLGRERSFQGAGMLDVLRALQSV